MSIPKIKIRRINAGLETEEAVERLQISKSTFYKLERGWGNPSTRVIARMAKAYECTIDDIFKDLNITG